jgi:protein gp37
MADHTKIEWTDATWNPITGCQIVSPGCTNCYAMKLAGSRLQHHPSRAGLTKESKSGPVWTGEVRFNREWLTQPLQWTKPRMIFVCAHGDLFADGVKDEWLDQIFAVMALAPHHIFQVLTKRPERMRDYLSDDDKMQQLAWTALEMAQTRQGTSTQQLVIPNREDDDPHFSPWPLRNVWLGTSVEDQRRANERILHLLNTPAAIRWVSAEPLLGLVDLRKICVIPKVPGSVRAGIHVDALAGRYCESQMRYIGDWDVDGPYPSDASAVKLDWVVAGGESGPSARPMHPDWIRSIRDQCSDAEAPFLFKQWGNWQIASEGNGHIDHQMERNDAYWVDIDGKRHKPSSIGLTKPYAMHRVTKAVAGRLLDGVEHNAFPPLPQHFKDSSNA